MSIQALVSRRLAALALALAVAVGGCNPTPSASPSAAPITPAPATPATSEAPATSEDPAAEIYSAIRQQVETIRGLEPTADVDPVTIDEEQLRKNLAAEFDAENNAADLEFSEQTLIALGLLPKGASLRDITLDFQAGQVAGYYSPDKKELYVVSRSGGVGAAEKVTYAHEFTHQLDDQKFDLAKLGTDSANQSDRALAQLGLIEGDAVSVQTTWTIQNLTPEELGELLQASLDPEALEALRRAPAYLRETALFPYQDGMAFVSGLLASGGYDAVNAAYADPPRSTEQILHPAKYAQREAPVEIRLPADLAAKMGAGWTLVGEDTLGELILRIWLTEHGVAGPGSLQSCQPSLTACQATAGWGGDRLALLRGPSGDLAIGLRTEWDSVRDAEEFADQMSVVLGSVGGDHATLHEIQRPRIVVIAMGTDAARLAHLIAG